MNSFLFHLFLGIYKTFVELRLNNRFSSRDVFHTFLGSSFLEIRLSETALFAFFENEVFYMDFHSTGFILKCHIF